MKHALPSLDALKVFESAARQLSFSRAAQELCLTKGAVSYQIRRLEEALDCALFRRAVRQVYLTDAGQHLLQTMQPLFEELEQTLAKIGQGDSGNEVLIGITTYVALRWLSPRLASFSDRNPDIPILMRHTVNDEDFKLQDVDFAIYWCEMQGHTGRSRLIEMPMPLYPVCSPALLQRIGNPSRTGKWLPADLASPPFDETPLLCEARSLDLWASWYGEQDRPLSNPRRVIADANVRTQAAVDGLGWTMADALMQQELDHGLLVAPFEHRLEGYGYTIQAAPGRFANQDALKLRKWLLEHA